MLENHQLYVWLQRNDYLTEYVLETSINTQTNWLTMTNQFME
jgi:hypothetical protein